MSKSGCVTPPRPSFTSLHEPEPGLEYRNPRRGSVGARVRRPLQVESGRWLHHTAFRLDCESSPATPVPPTPFQYLSAPSATPVSHHTDTPDIPRTSVRIDWTGGIQTSVTAHRDGLRGSRWNLRGPEVSGRLSVDVPPLDPSCRVTTRVSLPTRVAGPSAHARPDPPYTSSSVPHDTGVLVVHSAQVGVSYRDRVRHSLYLRLLWVGVDISSDGATVDVDPPLHTDGRRSRWFLVPSPLPSRPCAPECGPVYHPLRSQTSKSRKEPLPAPCKPELGVVSLLQYYVGG